MAEPAISDAPVVIDVTDADFMESVVEESKRRPVLVDLWASWCAPCRTLGPILEKVAGERDGGVLIAKIDVDANPYTAGQFGVQSIPTVLGFVGGELVDGFVGAIPEQKVNEFVDRLLPSESDRAAARALEEEQAGDVTDAEREYRWVLTEDPGNRTARLGLGRILIERGDLDEARTWLNPVSPDPEADRLLASIRVSEWSGLNQTSGLDGAKRLAAQGEFREALEAMLKMIRDDPAAREAMLDVFAVLGEEDSLTQEYRRKLASALF